MNPETGCVTVRFLFSVYAICSLIQTSAEEEQAGYDVDYRLDLCRLCAGLVDIFRIRGLEGSYPHVGGCNFSVESSRNLQFAEKFKRGHKNSE